MTSIAVVPSGLACLGLSPKPEGFGAVPHREPHASGQGGRTLTGSPLVETTSGPMASFH